MCVLNDVYISGRPWPTATSHATALAPEKNFFNTSCNILQLLKFDNYLVKEKKIYKLPEQNILNKMACLKMLFQYHVTHDVSVYAIRRRNGCNICGLRHSEQL